MCRTPEHSEPGTAPVAWLPRVWFFGRVALVLLIITNKILVRRLA